MNCEDGKCVYLKCTAVEKVFMQEHMQAIQSLTFFLFSSLLFFFCRHETVGFTIAPARGLINRPPDARELKLEGGWHILANFLVNHSVSEENAFAGRYNKSGTECFSEL